MRHIALDDALQEPEGRQGRPGLDRLHPVEQEGEEEQVHDDADAPFIPVEERARVVRQEAVEPALVCMVEDDQQNGKNAQGIEA